MKADGFKNFPWLSAVGIVGSFGILVDLIIKNYPVEPWNIVFVLTLITGCLVLISVSQAFRIKRLKALVSEEGPDKMKWERHAALAESEQLIDTNGFSNVSLNLRDHPNIP